MQGGGDAAQPGAAAAPAAAGTLADLAARIDNSYLRQLRADPLGAENAPNTTAREVFSGHYVRVAPRALREPYLVAYSAELAGELGLAPAACEGAAFLRVFSGDLGGAPAGFEREGWATPYANSIYGDPVLNPAPGVGPSGYGYGDGRAISLCEVLLPGAPPGPGRLELQLKGAGPTPFRRSGDGQAVLRSSVREFLASEAMHALGVPTTRTLCLLASASPADTTVRPWFNEAGAEVMVRNIRAVTTRVARSLLRVGQFELYGRRAARGEAAGLAELALLARHALAREYPHLAPGEGDASPGALQGAVLGMLREAGARLAALATHWLRVGYVQSNFNSDNCLVGGVTMDYGPFGFMERYDPRWGMWVGSGEHFAYGNQPTAAGVNFSMLAQSLLPLLDATGREQARALVEGYPALARAAVAAMWGSKLGFPQGARTPAFAAVANALNELMASHPTDFVLCWRLLARALPEGGALGAAALDSQQQAALLTRCLDALQPAFYLPLGEGKEKEWRGCAFVSRAPPAPPRAATGTRAGSPPPFHDPPPPFSTLGLRRAGLLAPGARCRGR